IPLNYIESGSQLATNCRNNLAAIEDLSRFVHGFPVKVIFMDVNLLLSFLFSSNSSFVENVLLNIVLLHPYLRILQSCTNTLVPLIQGEFFKNPRSMTGAK